MTGTRKFDHITPVQRQLHSLPVRHANHLQVAMITYKINAFTVWRRPTWLMCVPPFRPSSARGSCSRQTAGHSSCRVQELRSVGETLPCRARRHGTASPSNFGLHLCLPIHLHKDSKSHLCGCYRLWGLRIIGAIQMYVVIHSFIHHWVMSRHRCATMHHTIGLTTNALAET